MFEHSDRLPALARVALATLVGAVVGGLAVRLSTPTPQPPEWLTQRVESLSQQEAALQTEVGRLRLELSHSRNGMQTPKK